MAIVLISLVAALTFYGMRRYAAHRERKRWDRLADSLRTNPRAVWRKKP